MHMDEIGRVTGSKFGLRNIEFERRAIAVRGLHVAAAGCFLAHHLHPPAFHQRLKESYAIET
jgi:hypothetical protein